MKNSKSKQIVKSDGILLTLALLVAAVFSLRPLWRSLDEEKNDQARAHAEGLGYQLLQMRADFGGAVALRGPASVAKNSSESLVFREQGEIGTDPWGSSFSYRTVKSASGEFQFIEVWSNHMTERMRIQSYGASR